MRPGNTLDPVVAFRVCKAYNDLGGRHVKITGGEPSLWPHLVDLVRHLKQEVGIERVDVLSRDPAIGDLAPRLATAGTDLLNVSLDTLRPTVHRMITGVNDLAELLEAIESCVATGIDTKINMVILADINSEEVPDMIRYCERNGIKTLKLLDVIKDLHSGTEGYRSRLASLHGGSLQDLYTPIRPLAEKLRAKAVKTRTVNQGGLGHPMLSLQMPSGLEIVMKDHSAGAWYGRKCDNCRYFPCHDALMGLRLTPDNRLQYCLLRDDVFVDLRPSLISPTNGLVGVVRGALSVFESAIFRGSIGPHEDK